MTIAPDKSGTAMPGPQPAAAGPGRRATEFVFALKTKAAWIVAAVALWAVLARVLPKGLPLGVVLLGVVYGALYALVAIGIVLVYRGNRIINFAQAEFGVIAAIVAIEMVVTWHQNYFVAILVGIVGAVLLGAVVNRLIIRRFRRSSRLILTVATIGLAQLLGGLSALIPLKICDPAKNPNCVNASLNQSFNTPLHTQFSIYPVTFSGNDIVALGATIAIVVALAAFLRYSRYGVAIRAAAENGDRATLLGIPVPRLDTIVWCLAAVLSAVAVLLRVPVLGFTGFQTVSGGGNDILIRTLAAAVIGRMASLPVTAVAAIAIGIFESLATWTFANTVVVDATLVLVIVAALILQRGAYVRVSESDSSTWRSVAEVRPIPRMMLRLPEIRWGIWGSRAVLVLVALLVPVVFSSSQTYLVAAILIYCIVGLSLLVLTGWTGQISLGQFGLAGVGGATTALLFAQHGWNLVPALAAGVAVGALAALLIGLPALRISGPFLAVTTLAFGISVSNYILSPQYLGWFSTPQLTRPTFFGHHLIDSDTGIYFACLICFVAVLMGVRSLRRSRTGRSLIATRDNEPAAGAAALSTTRMKLTAFLVSGAIAGFAGALFVIHQRGVNQGSFSADINIALFSMVVIGGLGSVPGVVLGAVYVWSTQYFLTGGWSFIASGGGILILLMFLPEGLGGLIYMIRDRLLRTIANRRHLDVPGLVRTSAASATEASTALLDEVVSEAREDTGDGRRDAAPPRAEEATR